MLFGAADPAIVGSTRCAGCGSSVCSVAPKVARSTHAAEAAAPARYPTLSGPHGHLSPNWGSNLRLNCPFFLLTENALLFQKYFLPNRTRCGLNFHQVHPSNLILNINGIG